MGKTANLLMISCCTVILSVIALLHGRSGMALGLLVGLAVGGGVWLSVRRASAAAANRLSITRQRLSPQTPKRESPDSALRRQAFLLKLQSHGPFVSGSEAPGEGGNTGDGSHVVYFDLSVVSGAHQKLVITAIESGQDLPVLWTLAERRPGSGMQHPYGGAMPDKPRLLLRDFEVRPVLIDDGLRSYSIPLGVSAPLGTTRITGKAEGHIDGTPFSNTFEVNLAGACAMGNW